MLLEVPHSPALPPGLQQGLQGLPVRERAQWGSLAPPLGPSSQAPNTLTFSPFAPGGPTIVCGECLVSYFASCRISPIPLPLALLDERFKLGWRWGQKSPVQGPPWVQVLL